MDEEEARAQDVWREREAEKRNRLEEEQAEGEKVNGSLEEERLHILERQLQVAIREKEEQCQTFRELLLEKEKEIEDLSGMVEEREAEGVVEEKEERMEVWTGYKMKLVEVLRAGDQLNKEEDVSYDQLLNIVEQLVRDKQVKVFTETNTNRSFLNIAG